MKARLGLSLLFFRKAYIPYYEEKSKEEIDMKALNYLKQACVGLVVGVLVILLVKPCKLLVEKVKQMLPIKSKEQ